MAALFSPPPVGVGTPDVEGLASYLTRLAAAHSLTVGAFVRSSLPVLLRPTESTRRTNVGELPAVAERASGMSGTAETWSTTIGELVGRDLRGLTLRGWSPALAGSGYLRRRIAHCPSCLDDMAAAGSVYEPLAWSIAQVTHCLRHGSILHLRCPHCVREQSPLRLRGRPGLCGSCRRWLGGHRAEGDQGTGSARSRAVAELIPVELSRPLLLQAIELAVARVGSQRALAEHAGVGSGSLSMWRRGLLRPSLDAVLDLCGAGSWDVGQFLQGELIPGSSASADLAPAPRVRRARIDWPATARRLSALAGRPRPPSLAQACRELGIDKRSLRTHVPEETQRLVQARRDARHSAATLRAAHLTGLVAEVTANLLASGSKASRRDVERSLPGGHLLREPALGDAWRRARALGADKRCRP